ncbi:hypothetical protein EDB92DRAFT_543074 [Lactarius akahatsu]|uniref:Uncharacterized protein n=1 Tax=Lactarius akahatsu TaxID=416441 RepID=A0AAD4LMN7_9AGAM|nr:hypothetical protein EDB92DRAFT_543074 [Lactarius akahatsu]
MHGDGGHRFFSGFAPYVFGCGRTPPLPMIVRRLIGTFSRSYGTPAVTNQGSTPRSKRAIPGQRDPPDLGFISIGLSAQRFREINVSNTTISKRSNSTVTGIGVIAGGILVACLAVLLLGLLPCYLKRRRARLRKPVVVDTENGAITQIHHESDNSVTPLSIVKEESIRSVTSVSQASSETVVPTVETEERRSPPPVVRKGSLPSSPSSSLRRFGDRAGGAPMPAPPAPLLVRPGSANSDHDRGFLDGNASAPARSRSVRFAGPNGRVTRTPSSAHSILPNPWDRGESPPPLPGSSFERALYQLPAVPESAPPVPPPRRAYSLRAPGLPRSPRDPRDFPVSLRAETRSPSIRETASEHRKSFVDARRSIRPI